ncbi:MAG TPA: glycosyltransferase family 2 protein [Pirellulales bacterium]|jgi:cellulose synthase/poly-beta-1,6-N-acetylglucosamine synthase-like glycosyltransferase|nr:glycosyltransferase family 2 protein [Pirellulales bacterium]
MSVVLDAASVVAGIAASVVAVPIGVLCAECVAALLPSGGDYAHGQPGDTDDCRVDVLIPAHNEQAVLGETLAALAEQLAPGDRVWVIADNCDDDTAAIARRARVNALERRDAVRRGKGYALDYAVRLLESDPGDVVVILDADCELSPGSLRQMARMAHHSRHPVQAGYTMAAAASRPRDAVSQLAVLVKNIVRPLGLSRLGLPCLLTGSGMAFPWPVIRDASLASGNIVEDMKLSIDMLLAGTPPRFCPEAGVSAMLPGERRAVTSQRTRWEHGHLQTILSQTPRLLRAAMRGRRPSLLASALDLAIPPLSLLVIAWCAAAMMALVCGLLGAGWLPMAISAVSGSMLAAVVVAVNAKFGAGGSWRALLAVPLYVAGKVPIYLGFLWRRQTAWVRTAR